MVSLANFLVSDSLFLRSGQGQITVFLPGASVRNPARDKVMRKEADIRKACSDFRDLLSQMGVLHFSPDVK